MGENYQYQNEQELSLLNEPMPLYGLTKIAIIRQGLSFNSITSIIEKTGLTRQELANILQVSVRTLQR
ncbi:MAG: hypothetical protein KDC92_08765, partial [Bacteroidetes bacterium]|nr:hypothetical protein [Bacteroidota bacterium]